MFISDSRASDSRDSSFHPPFHLPHARITDQYVVRRTTLEISRDSRNIASIPRTPLYQSRFFSRPHYWFGFLRFRDDALRTHVYNGRFYLTLLSRRMARSITRTAAPMEHFRVTHDARKTIEVLWTNQGKDSLWIKFASSSFQQSISYVLRIELSTNHPSDE